MEFCRPFGISAEMSRAKDRSVQAKGPKCLGAELSWSEVSLSRLPVPTASCVAAAAAWLPKLMAAAFAAFSQRCTRGCRKAIQIV